MNASPPPATDPFFLNPGENQLFAVHHAPKKDIRGAVLHIPPFAEEMNRCRRMATLTADVLASAGFAVLRLDLFGTGDSAGDFAEADWTRWHADIAAATAWLRERYPNVPVSYWGVRLGSLLATEAALADGDIQRLVLWQPQPSGKTALTQFLRIRVAASALDGGGDKETAGALRTAIAETGSIEVAGYEVTEALATGMEGANLSAAAPPPSMAVDWIELTTSDKPALTPGAARVIEAWQDAGANVTAHVVEGEPFWNIQEQTLAPELIQHTRHLFLRDAA